MSTKKLVHQENKILDEVIDVLVNPDKYSIEKNELFEYLNKYTAPDEDDEDADELEQQISTKMVDFNKFLTLGRMLAAKKPATVEELQQALSKTVYINHLQTTTEFAPPQSYEAPTTSPYYMPDLRLPIKNVLVLFVNYFKKQEPDEAALTGLRNLMLLLNVSVINKLVGIFRTLNPRFSLKDEASLVGL